MCASAVGMSAVGMQHYVEVACDYCGKLFLRYRKNMLGKTCCCSISCSMRLKNPARTHAHTTGRTASPTYSSWANMKKRCDNPTDPKFPDYGGRGIGYDPRWASFEAFLADMGEKPLGTSIDRIDNDRGYSRDNCRWGTHMQQVMNRRCTRRVSYDGEEWTMADLACHLGISRQCLDKRLAAGYSEDDLRKPVRRSRSATP
jgi:hypothetical protein